MIATGSMVRIKMQRETHKRGVADNKQFLFNAEQKLLTVPFYFFPFIAQDLAAGTLKP